MGIIEHEPTTMFVRTSENCNAGCFMCDYAHQKGKPMLQPDQVEQIAEQSKKAGIKLIRFTGGEPLLDTNLSDYISYLSNQGFQTSVITNGYLLPLKAKSLSEAGLNQIIVSLDGDNEDLHDRLRNTPNLFKKATQGLSEIKKINPNILTRVNTVVSPFNITRLGNILDLLQNLNVDQWSIIPIKGQKNIWISTDIESVMEIYTDFQRDVSNIDNPRFLGFSKQWAGRNKDEAIRYFRTGIPFTPKNACGLVNLVRFYIPQSDKLTACNCVPWRLGDVDIDTEISLSGLNDDSMSPVVNYLRQNGSEICKGCEPINTFLAENPSILKDDLYTF